MVKTIRKVGNSNALLLDKAIMELIGLREGGAVKLTITNGSLLVTPVAARAADQEQFQQCLDHVMKTRHKLLKRLSQ